MTDQETQTIPAGYKQTEVGVIPNDWEVKQLRKIGKCIRGVSYDGERDLSSYDTDVTVRLLRSNNVQDGKIDLNELQFVNNKKVKPIQYIQEDDIVICMANGSKQLVGKSAIFEPLDSYAYTFGAFMGCFQTDSSQADSKFISNTFQTHQYRSFIDILLSGSSINNLKPSDIESIEIPFPPVPEQTAIASILSDADSLIEKLEKLIAKKRAIKQGMMQGLLTGKCCLVGFSGKWERKNMGEIGKPYGGLSGKTKRDFKNGTYPYIPFLNIMNNPTVDTSFFDYVSMKPGERQNKVQKGDLFFNGSSETSEEVGMCSVLMDDIPNLYLNSFCFGFRLNKDLNTNGLYLSYFFRSNTGRQLIFFLAQGATRHNLSKNNFLKLEIPYPRPEEQAAIAGVISDMDEEIKSLEQKLAKYRMLKQGMMQVLLTGKIRLI